MAKKESMFRQESLAKVSHGGESGSYLHATKPSWWFALGAVAVFMVGLLVWGILGRVESKAYTVVTVTGGQATCVTAGRDAVNTKTGMLVRLEYGQTYTVVDGDRVSVRVGDDDTMVTEVTGTPAGKFVEQFPLGNPSEEVPDGTYRGVVVIEEIQPIRFIFQ